MDLSSLHVSLLVFRISLTFVFYGNADQIIDFINLTFTPRNTEDIDLRSIRLEDAGVVLQIADKVDLKRRTINMLHSLTRNED